MRGQFKHTLPSTYSMTMHRCLRVSNEQNIDTTKGFSAKVRMSRSTNTCWIWFRSIRFCRLIFFMAKRWRVSLWRTRNTALHGRKRKKVCKRGERSTIMGHIGIYWSGCREINCEILPEKEGGEKKDEETCTSVPTWREVIQTNFSCRNKNTTTAHPHFSFFSAFIGLSVASTKKLMSQMPTEKKVLLTHRRHC